MRYEKACRNREDLEVLRSATAMRYKMVVARINTMLTENASPEVLKLQLEIMKIRARDSLMQMELLEMTEWEEMETKLNNFQKVHIETVKKIVEALARKSCFICEGKHEEGPEKCQLFLNATPLLAHIIHRTSIGYPMVHFPFVHLL